MSLYYPEALDNSTQAKDKLDRLSDYFSESLQLLSQGKVDTALGDKFRKLDAENKKPATSGGSTPSGTKIIRLPNGGIAVKKKQG